MTDAEKFEILRQICVDYGLLRYMRDYTSFWESVLHLTPEQMVQDIVLVEKLLDGQRPLNNTRARERLG